VVLEEERCVVEEGLVNKDCLLWGDLVLALMDETLVMRIEAERTLVHQLDHWQGGHINQGLH
jgi:hypothetical protein